MGHVTSPPMADTFYSSFQGHGVQGPRTRENSLPGSLNECCSICLENDSQVRLPSLHFYASLMDTELFIERVQALPLDVTTSRDSYALS